MNSFRNPKYLERYEDVPFELETALVAPVGAALQKKENHRFVVDNSGEVTPFDWFNSRISVDFKLVLSANGGNIAANDRNGIVNGIHSFIKHIDVKFNGKKVYDCSNCNHAVNIKNLLNYSRDHALSTATNELYYIDTSRHANDREFNIDGVNHNHITGRNANFNKGFSMRKKRLGVSSTVNAEVTMNKFSYFEALEKQLLPNGRLEINLDLDSDDNVVWQAGADCKLVFSKIQLLVPRMTFNSLGQSLYLDEFVKKPSQKWTYLNEEIYKSNSSNQRTGHFNITTGVSKPRHVFVFIINDAKIDVQTENSFLYDTFSVSINPRTLTNCHLVVGNSHDYSEIRYEPTTNPSRVYRDVLKYVHKNTLLTIENFKNLFPFIYFDLTKQKLDIRDGTTKLTFKYELSGVTATPYSIYALVLNEQDAEVIHKDGKLMLR